MSAAERTELLGRWIQPSSENEQSQQERAEKMVRQAIADCDGLDGAAVAIYTKGSYPNNTNVRRDSDVDVVVELRDCLYYDYMPGVTGVEPPPPPYKGPWNPERWRRAVVDALVAAFGASVDTSGKVAINVGAVAGSRPSADVVPSFNYRRYDDAYRNIRQQGSCVFPTDGGGQIINWPQQQLDNGRSLNEATGHRYKKYVRALKNAENSLVLTGDIEELPSYFMECLVFNASPSALAFGDLDDGFRATLLDLWDRLVAEEGTRTMVEPNRMKWLFADGKKWAVQDGKDLVLATWHYLGHGS